MTEFRASPDPLAQWMQTFQVVYALTANAIEELSNQEPGVIRKSSGEGLQIRKITADMLQSNRQLASEVYALALSGYLGFGQENGRISFRQDVAEKILGRQENGGKPSSTRTFKVISHGTEETPEEIDADIEAIDQESYAALLANRDTDQEKKPEKESKATVSTPRFTPTLSKDMGSAHKRSLAVQNFASGVISQMRTNEENRRKNAEQKKEFQEEIDRTKLKDRILKDEIKKEGIVASEKAKSNERVNRNFDKPTQNK